MIDECVIQEVPYIKYLGVTIDSQIMWNEYIRTIIKNANAVKAFCIGTYSLAQPGSNLTIIKT